MKVLVLGAGAIGGYFGGRMAAAGTDVTFLVRPGRRAQLDRDGLIVEGARSNIKMPVQTVDASELRDDYDVVLLTCKSYDLDSAMDAIAPAMAGRAVIVPMLNGMSHFDVLDKRFGRKKVLGGLCAIMAVLREDGSIKQLSDLDRIVVGARTPGTQTVAKEFSQVLAESKVDAVLSENVEQDLWEKIVFLSAAAALTCVFRANFAEILAASGGPEAVDNVLDTNMAISEKEGFPQRPAAVKFANARLKVPSPFTASMLRDLESGHRVESDQIVGFMLDHARKHALDDKILSVAYTHLKAYENRREAGRLAPES